MKVCVSVKGRFHAFDLARELHRGGSLYRLITSYPAFAAERFGLPRTMVRSLPEHEVLERLWVRMPRQLRDPMNKRLLVQERLHDLFDRRVSMQLHGGFDLFVGWASLSLRSIRRARACGAKTVVERGSSHVEFQESILREEYDRVGLPSGQRSKYSVERDLTEYAEADFISVPSSFVMRTFLDKGIPKEKLIRVAYGVDLGQFRSLGKADSMFRVVHCGALSIRKGVHYLLQAFSELRLPNAELWLIGPLLEEMKPFLRRFGSDTIRHLGPFPQRELPKYYSMGSVFCLASIEEGLAMVQAQAMACGLPVICSTNTGGEDLVAHGKHGFVVPIRSVDALKQRIQQLYESPDLCRQMGEAARQHAAEHLSWAQYGAHMQEHYRRILGEQPAVARA